MGKNNREFPKIKKLIMSKAMVLLICSVYLTVTIARLTKIDYKEVSAQKENDEDYPHEEDYVEFERPKKTFIEKIFHKKTERLANLPKRLPQWILDIIPFYGKNFKSLSSGSKSHDHPPVSTVYEAPIKLPVNTSKKWYLIHQSTLPKNGT